MLQCDHPWGVASGLTGLPEEVPCSSGSGRAPGLMMAGYLSTPGLKCRKGINENVLSAHGHAAKRRRRARALKPMSRLSVLRFEGGGGPVASPLIKLHTPMFVLKY